MLRTMLRHVKGTTSKGTDAGNTAAQLRRASRAAASPGPPGAVRACGLHSPARNQPRVRTRGSILPATRRLRRRTRWRMPPHRCATAFTVARNRALPITSRTNIPAISTAQTGSASRRHCQFTPTPKSTSAKRHPIRCSRESLPGGFPKSPIGSSDGSSARWYAYESFRYAPQSRQRSRRAFQSLVAGLQLSLRGDCSRNRPRRHGTTAGTMAGRRGGSSIPRTRDLERDDRLGHDGARPRHEAPAQRASAVDYVGRQRVNGYKGATTVRHVER